MQTPATDYGAWPMYNLKALHIFVVVAETASFRRAAEILGRSQSAVSMQIKMFEEQLGIPLFHRTTRRVKLTPEGEKLLGHAQRAVAELNIGLRQIRDTASVQSGTIALGCVPSIAATALPDVLAEFRRQRPGISVRLRELTSRDLMESVGKLDVDFGIGPHVERLADFEFTPIVDETIYAVLPPAYALSGRSSITLEELAKMPVLMASTSAALRGNLDRELKERGLNLESSFEVLHVQTMFALARAGLGVAVLPAGTIPEPLDAGLQALPITGPRLSRRICLITLKGNFLSPASQELAKLVVDRFRTARRFSDGESPG